MLYQVMLRIVGQDIPQSVINNPQVQWNPFLNKVFSGEKEAPAAAEPNTRYKVFLDIFRAQKKLDPYFPALPTHIRRKFEVAREIPESEVEKLFTDFISSAQVRSVAKLISRRLGRPLQPFDIWYNGFKAGGAIPEEDLDKIISRKYPTTEAFQADLGNILLNLGFSREQADYLTPRIQVDPSRGAGHAAGAEMRTDKARLRTRIPAQGMNYKGYNIAVHELGHTVEQTLTLQKVDHYMLRGVPNTAFTEAFAFVFQDRDLDLLEVKGEVAEAKDLKALKSLWDSYEIMGVSLVDMHVWNWLYQHPEATTAQFKEAVISIAKDVWNKYFADVMGVRDQPILADDRRRSVPARLSVGPCHRVPDRPVPGGQEPGPGDGADVPAGPDHPPVVDGGRGRLENFHSAAAGRRGGGAEAYPELRTLFQYPHNGQPASG
jgi:hypothetical protein